jgi:1,4-alpha-glucan branching enzyme
MGKVSSATKHHNTPLSVAAPDAHEVYVAGSFNKWEPTATRMVRNGAGPWRAELDLPPGRYEYKFVIDGQWCCEPGCDRAYSGCANCMANPFGTMNRVLTVES